MEVFIGTIQPFAFNFAPRDWALCNGQTLSVAQYSALFSLISTLYGGDGISTFKLPDLRGRLPLGQGAGTNLTPRVIGNFNGSESVTATLANLPAHTHDTSGLTVASALQLASLPSNAATTPTGTNAYLGASSSGGPSSAAIYSDQQGANPVTLKGLSTTLSGTVASTGQGLPMATMNPFLAINFSIALSGLYPTRE